MIRVLAIVLVCLSAAPLLPGQDASGVRLRSIALDADGPVADYALVALRDERRDVLLLTRDRRLVPWYRGEDGTFARGPAVSLPERAAAWGLVRLGDGPESAVVVLHSGGVDRLPLEGEGAGRPTPLVSAPLVFPARPSGPPRFWTWGEDADGDARPDLLLPGLDAPLVVRGRAGRGGPFGPPLVIPLAATVERAVGAGGALEVIRRRPRLGFVALEPDAPPRALWLADDGVAEVLGDAVRGFESASRIRYGFPREDQGALGVLERTEVDFADLDGDRRPELVLSRTAARGGGSLDLKTTLVFFPPGAPPVERPSHVLRLPGVLSAGPQLEDLDGDGRPDLFVTVFGGVRSEIARRIFRRVTLTSYVYRGREGRAPFGRSPDLTLEDRVPDAVFDTWGLRHRQLLSLDWTGDGRADLVELRGDADAVSVVVRPARLAPEPYALDEPEGEPLVIDGAPLGHALRTLDDGPVLVVQHARGLTLVLRR